MLLSVATSHLLIIDIQEKLLPVIADSEKLVKAATKLLAIAAIVGVKASFTQQYPKGLGSTPASLQALAPEARIFDKTEFSCMRDAEIRGHIEDLQRANVTQIVLAGAETHICVLQTASDLSSAGLDVFVAIDACGSRNEDSSRRTRAHRSRRFRRLIRGRESSGATTVRLRPTPSITKTCFN